jgi:hypothetical protein
MVASKNIARLALCLVSAVAACAAGLGCTAEVDSGTNSEGGGGAGGGEEGEGGKPNSDGCKSYIGDGCTPGELQSCGFPPPQDTMQRHCELVDQFCRTQWSYNDCNTPLVLSFDGAPVEYGTDAAHGFTVNGATSLVTDWPTAKTPWLALDRDGSGSIEDGRELFGSMSPLAGGGAAANGFVALRELDESGDGQITADDPAFTRLLVWSDRDGDRRSAPGELASAASWELVSIELGYANLPRCDARGNCEVERASFRYRDAAGATRTGAVIDVHLAPQY